MCWFGCKEPHAFVTFVRTLTYTVFWKALEKPRHFRMCRSPERLLFMAHDTSNILYIGFNIFERPFLYSKRHQCRSILSMFESNSSQTPKFRPVQEMWIFAFDNVRAAFFVRLILVSVRALGKRWIFFWKALHHGKWSFWYRVKQTTSASVRNNVQGWIFRKLEHKMTVKPSSRLKDFRCHWRFTWFMMELTGSAGSDSGLDDNAVHADDQRRSL